MRPQKEIRNKILENEIKSIVVIQLQRTWRDCGCVLGLLEKTELKSETLSFGRRM
jgi:hypothetical protein